MRVSRASPCPCPSTPPAQATTANTTYAAHQAAVATRLRSATAPMIAIAHTRPHQRAPRPPSLPPIHQNHALRPNGAVAASHAPLPATQIVPLTCPIPFGRVPVPGSPTSPFQLPSILLSSARALGATVTHTLSDGRTQLCAHTGARLAMSCCCSSGGTSPLQCTSLPMLCKLLHPNNQSKRSLKALHCNRAGGHDGARN